MGCIHFLESKAWFFIVGNSLIYRLRKKEFCCLTEDHSLKNRLKHRLGLSKQLENLYPCRHILTNVLGSRPHVVPDIRDITYEEKDLFLFCSDGLTNMVSDRDMRDILLSSSSLEESGNLLISLANSRGGVDNVTIVLVRIQ